MPLIQEECKFDEAKSKLDCGVSWRANCLDLAGGVLFDPAWSLSDVPACGLDARVAGGKLCLIDSWPWQTKEASWQIYDAKKAATNRRDAHRRSSRTGMCDTERTLRAWSGKASSPRK